MLELAFLLLPIAAAYGWYMGRNSIKQNDQSVKEALSKNSPLVLIIYYQINKIKR